MLTHNEVAFWQPCIPVAHSSKSCSQDSPIKPTRHMHTSGATHCPEFRHRWLHTAMRKELISFPVSDSCHRRITNYALTFTLESVPGITILASTMMRALRIHTMGILVARVLARITFIDFNAIEFIYSTIAWQTFTYI